MKTTRKQAREIVNEFVDRFIVDQGDGLEFKAEYGEFEAWVEHILEKDRARMLDDFVKRVCSKHMEASEYLPKAMKYYLSTIKTEEEK